MTGMIEIKYSDADMARFKNRFSERRQVRVAAAVKDQRGAGAMLLFNEIHQQINIQKLVDTGKYRASWKVDLDAHGTTANVFTSHPAARRLEYGFSGRDSLGRLYNNPARPHVRPALVAVRQKIAENIAVAVVKEMERD